MLNTHVCFNEYLCGRQLVRYVEEINNVVTVISIQSAGERLHYYWFHAFNFFTCFFSDYHAGNISQMTW